MAFSFDSSRVSAAADALHEVALDDAQRALVRELGNLVGPKLGLDPIPCSGMWLQAVRAWQHANKRRAVEISALPPQQRLHAALEIKDHFREIASSMLRAPEQQDALNEAIEDAYQLYLSNYNRR